ncbi:MAG: hypothetical protein ACUVQK_12285 [Thermogutta sp.]
MSISAILARLLGLPSGNIEEIRIGLTAPWVENGWGRLAIAVIAVIAWAVFFYYRRQKCERPQTRLILTTLRAVALAFVVGILAEPIAVVRLSRPVRPAVWLLVDDTQSMTIRDAWSPQEAAELAPLVRSSLKGREASPGDGDAAVGFSPSRLDLLRGLFAADDGAFLRQLRQRCRLRLFRFSRPDGVDNLDWGEAESGSRPTGKDGDPIGEGLSGAGSVTAIGAALADLARRKSGREPAAIVVFSDFNHNSGPPPEPILASLGVPVHTVGLGKAETEDLALEMQLPPLMKKGEAASILVTLRNQMLTGRDVTVRLTVLPYRSGAAVPAASGESGAGGAAGTASVEAAQPIGEQTVTLTDDVRELEFRYTPSEVGHFVFRAEADPFSEERVTDNNAVMRDNYVRDYFLRLLFIEDEPSWEWRFIKEVFHRDPLVGPEGFRTFLRSADPQVRERNPLFVPVLRMPRKDLFLYDVVILSDVSADMLTEGFCEQLEQFVAQFGGGLVVLAGPRFGPGHWARSALEPMLPVQVSPQARLRDRPFALKRTPEAALTDFMRLGDSAEEDEKAWANLGNVPWYYPVERVRPLAGALAVHPTDVCLDGKTPQPIVAIQRYGRGEVVYIGFNEWWRLRRKYGELYYRRFWGQLIHRLAMRHVLGTQKRFVVQTDHARYQTGDEVVLTVEAYDADFQPLSESRIPDRALLGTVAPDSPNATLQAERELAVTQVRPGLFQAKFRVFEEGEFTAKVLDPVTQESVVTRFQVAARSVEMDAATRNRELQVELARKSGGRSYEITEVMRLLQDLPQDHQSETRLEEVALWNSWAAFLMVTTALLAEWFIRKWAQMA